MAQRALNVGAGYAFGGEKAQLLQSRIRAKLRDQKRNALADRVAEHGSVPLGADEIGVSRSYGRVLWAEIRRDLGWQAC